MTDHNAHSPTSGRIPTACALLIALCAPAACAAGSQLGDGGHFLHHQPTVYIRNPDGAAFTVTMHRHIWPAARYNKGDYALWVLDPAGEEVARGAIPSGQAATTLRVPAGPKGVYVLRHKPSGYSLTWIACSLPRMVVGQGPWSPEAAAAEAEAAGTKSRWPYGTFILHVMAPRRWYFYVPPGVERFHVKHTVFRFQSHREDYGFVVMNPRGQRVEAVYGGKPLPADPPEGNREIPIVRTIETDAGTTGRFWSIWATGGDSHNFSDLQILLRGVPPFLAPAPEQWFNPQTGEVPPRLVYDTSEIRKRDERGKLTKDGERLSRDHFLWTPTPFLGDEDYNGMRGPHTVFLDNPEGRAVDVGVCSYILPRDAREPIGRRHVLSL